MLPNNDALLFVEIHPTQGLDADGAILPGEGLSDLGVQLELTDFVRLREGFEDLSSSLGSVPGL
jgi:hypothetical protein